MLRRLGQTAVALAMVVTAVSAAPPQRGQASLAPCRAVEPLAALPGVFEASGLTVSRAAPGRLWTHNDSPPAVLFAVDESGRVTSRVRLTGAALEDWEAIAAGPCPAGTCLYLGDIGDNNASRPRIAIYRVPDVRGTPPETIALTDVFYATYPDGAQDAETLLVTADGSLVIVTKGDSGPVAMYRFPRELKPGATHRLERVGAARNTGRVTAAQRVTDGSISPDGALVALRTNTQLTFHNAMDFFSGNWEPTARVDLRSLREPQGEGVALGAGGVVYLAGEGTARSRGGTFVRLECDESSARTK